MVCKLGAVGQVWGGGSTLGKSEIGRTGHLKSEIRNLKSENEEAKSGGIGLRVGREAFRDAFHSATPARRGPYAPIKQMQRYLRSARRGRSYAVFPISNSPRLDRPETPQPMAISQTCPTALSPASRTIPPWWTRRRLRGSPGISDHPLDLPPVAETAAQVARELERLGVQKGDHVVLWGDCLEWIAAYYGCVLRGAVAVPLDRIASPEFALTITRQVRARVAFGPREFLAHLQQSEERF